MSRGWVRRGVIVAVAVFLVTSLLVVAGPARPFSVVGRGGVDGVLFVVVAGCLVVAGLALSMVRPGSRAGLWLVGAGCASLLPVWAGWGTAAPWFRTLAAASGWFHGPLLAHALVTVPAAGGGIGEDRRATATLVSTAHAAAGTGAMAQVFLANPYRDQRCWADCAPNPFAILESPAPFALIRPVLLGVQAGVLVGVAALAAWAAIGARGRRTVLATAAAAAGCGAAGLIGLALAVMTDGTDDPAQPLGRAAVAIIAVSGLLAAATALASVVQSHRRRARLEDIAAGSPDGIEPALRRALRDPTVRVVYWLPELDRFADADGHVVPSPPASDPARTVTRIMRGEQLVAQVTHAPDAAGGWDAGPALAVAIHNASLRAQGRAQLEALREGRMRIVERADTHRRRLERDLHDGAQQLLIALAARLRTAAAAASGSPAGSELEAAVAEARAAIRELRVLAHGICPAVLANDGLAAAIRTLALGAPLPVELGELPVSRFGSGVEVAAYGFVAAAIEDAARRRASHARVSIDPGPAALTVAVTDDADEPSTLSIHAVDRVGAIDGVVESSAGVVTAVIPIRSGPSADSR